MKTYMNPKYQHTGKYCSRLLSNFNILKGNSTVTPYHHTNQTIHCIEKSTCQNKSRQKDYIPNIKIIV